MKLHTLNRIIVSLLISVELLFPVAAVGSRATDCLSGPETDACKQDCDANLPGRNHREARWDCRDKCHKQLCSSTELWDQVGRDIHGKHEGDRFGQSLDLSDDGMTLAVSASSGGYVRVFRLEGEGLDGSEEAWMKVGEDIEVPVNEDSEAGWAGSVSLSADGSVVAVGDMFSDVAGAGGNVFVYRWNENQRKWMPMGSPIIGGSKDAEFGRSVSLSANGKTLAVGAWFADEVRVFEFNGNAWRLKGQVIEGTAGSLFGVSVSIHGDGNGLAVAAPNDESGKIGSVTVWKFLASDKKWVLVHAHNPFGRGGPSSVSIPRDEVFVAYATYSYGDDPDPDSEPMELGWGYVDARQHVKVDISANGKVLACRGGAGVRVYELSGDPVEPNNVTALGAPFVGIYGCFDESDRSLALNANGTIFAVASVRCHDDGDGPGLVRVFRSKNEDSV